MVMQYRMHPHIAEIVSDIFYNGRLVTAPSVVAARRRRVAVHFIDVAGSESSEGTSFKNIQEARTVLEIVRKELMQASSGPATETMVCSNSRSRGNGAAGAVVPGSMHHATMQQCLVRQQQALGHARSMSIDVVAFHKPQVYAIRDALDRAGLFKLGKIDVTTVDSMQGRYVGSSCPCMFFGQLY